MRSATTLGVLATLVTVAAPSTAGAVDPAQPGYIAVAAHAQGVGSTVWRTDLQLKAGEGATAVFAIDLLQSGVDNSDPLSIDFSLVAGTSRSIADVLGQIFDHEGTGALRFTIREGSLEVTSRTYNDDPGGTYGQFIPSLADSDALGSADQGLLIGLPRSDTPNEGFRTNVGFLNVVSDAITLEVDLLAASGILLGTLPVQLEPYSHGQLTDIFGLVTDSDVANGWARIRATTDSARFFAYASVVDNRSGDPVFIPARSTLGSAASLLQGSWSGRMYVDMPEDEPDSIAGISVTFTGEAYRVETPDHFYEGTFAVIAGPEDPGWLSFAVTDTDDPDNIGDWDGVYALDGSSFVFGWYVTRPADLASAPWVIVVSRTVE